MLIVAVYTKLSFSLDVPFFRHALILRIGFFSVKVEIVQTKPKKKIHLSTHSSLHNIMFSYILSFHQDALCDIVVQGFVVCSHTEFRYSIDLTVNQKKTCRLM